MPTFLARTARVSVVCLGLAAISAMETTAAQPTTKATYFSGRLLTAEEFQQEQAYHSGGRGAAASYGQVSGLTVTSEDGAIKIAPGMALDAKGEKIVLPNMLRLDQPVVDGKRYAVVCADLRNLGRRCLLLAVVERKDGHVRVERARP